MKRAKEWRRGAGLLLSALLVFPIFAEKPDAVYAAEREVRTVNVNIANDLGMRNPRVPGSTADAWEGDKVRFGQYGGNPLTFRVLDKKTRDFGGETMFLDCDAILYNQKFDAAGSVVWESSSLQKELNTSFLGSSFSMREQGAIYQSQDPAAHKAWEQGEGGTWVYGALPSGGNKIFALDVREAEHEAYGYSHTGRGPAPWEIVENRKKIGGRYDSYWLRSADGSIPNYHAGCVDSAGRVGGDHPDLDIPSVSPACNLDLPAVLFGTVRGRSKSSFTKTEVPDNPYNEWVLTLNTGETGFTAVRTNPEDAITMMGGRIQLSLSGAVSGANQISALLLDSNNTALCYGKIAESGDSAAVVKLPMGLKTGAAYTLRVFSEEAYDDRTSYAGNMEDISFTVEEYILPFRMRERDYLNKEGIGKRLLVP